MRRINPKTTWKKRVGLGIIHLAKVVDAIVFFLSLSALDSELSVKVLFYCDRLDDWMES